MIKIEIPPNLSPTGLDDKLDEIIHQIGYYSQMQQLAFAMQIASEEKGFFILRYQKNMAELIFQEHRMIEQEEYEICDKIIRIAHKLDYDFRSTLKEYYDFNDDDEHIINNIANDLREAIKMSGI